MRFSIDPWDPSYGMANEVDEPEGTTVTVDLDTECPVAEWAPIAPSADVAVDRSIAFVDGVRRVDARIWVPGAPDPDGAPGPADPGVCASWAAGAVCCADGAAVIHPGAVEVGRSVAAPDPTGRLEAVVTPHVTYRPLEARGSAPEDLWLAVQQEMGRAEVRIATPPACPPPAP